MKILIIITTGFVIGGGLTNSYLNYYSQLDPNEFEIDFASSNEIDDELQFLLDTKASSYYNLGPRKKIFSYRNNLNKLLKSKDYDCVHIHGNSSSVYLELSCCVKQKINNKIIHIHNTRTSHPIINLIFNKYINSHSDYRLACSNEAGDWIFNKKFFVMKNCIDYNKFSIDLEAREKIRKHYKIDDDVYLIGTVGRMNEQKNQIFLIENFFVLDSIFKNCKLMIVGGGRLEETIKNKIKEKGLLDRIVLTGFKTNTNDFYNAMDFFVFPSSFEGFGMVCVEAQLTGLKCCISDSVPKIVSMSEYCSFYRCDDLNSYKMNLTMLNDKNETRDAIRNSSIHGLISNNFDVPSNVEVLKKIYRREV